jgi:hypothetical protein
VPCDSIFVPCDSIFVRILGDRTLIAISLSQIIKVVLNFVLKFWIYIHILRTACVRFISQCSDHLSFCYLSKV